jgi:hypothetical protein
VCEQRFKQFLPKTLMHHYTSLDCMNFLCNRSVQLRHRRTGLRTLHEAFLTKNAKVFAKEKTNLAKQYD